jgi:hypothetical protein
VEEPKSQSQVMDRYLMVSLNNLIYAINLLNTSLQMLLALLMRTPGTTAKH